MELTKADLDGARHESYFRQVRQLVAIASTEEFQKHAVPEFGTLDVKILDEVATLHKLGEEAEEIFYEKLGENLDVGSDAAAIDKHIEAADAWLDEAVASVEHARREGVDGADDLRRRLGQRETTAAATRDRMKVALKAAAHVHLPTFFLTVAWFERGMSLAHKLVERPGSLHINTYQRQLATQRLYELRALMAASFLKIASANEVVRFRVGQRAIGFDFGIVKSDRPDAPQEAAAAPPPPPGPSFRVVGGEEED